MRNVMLDIETLGTEMKAPVIQIAAVEFNEKGEEVSSFNQYCKLEGQLHINPSTLQWWLNTNKDIFIETAFNKNAKPLYEVLLNFIDWLKADKETFVWGNGSMFDNMFIKTKCIENGLQYPVYYRNDKDLRTLVGLAIEKTGKTQDELVAEGRQRISTITEHDALDDCLSQVQLLCLCREILLLQ